MLFQYDKTSIQLFEHLTDIKKRLLADVKPYVDIVQNEAKNHRSLGNFSLIRMLMPILYLARCFILFGLVHACTWLMPSERFMRLFSVVMPSIQLIDFGIVSVSYFLTLCTYLINRATIVKLNPTACILVPHLN